MTYSELQLLQQAADGELLLHNRAWGTNVGYLWRGPGGASAGTVPADTEATLERLAGLGYITTEHRRGPHECRVFVTLAGLAVLDGLARVA